MNEGNKHRALAAIPLWVFTALAIGVAAGFAIRSFTSSKPILQPMGKVGEIEEILHFVKEKYVDTVNVDDLENMAISKTLEGLDPHSSYIPASRMAEELEDIRGEYDGVGIEFYILEDTISVVTTTSGGPSEAVGIRSGDKIVTVNDSTVAGNGITNTQVLKLLKGKRNTKVNVGIKRTGVEDLIGFTITRAPIKLKSVDAAYMLNNNTGIIKVNTFSERTYQEFRISLEKLIQSGMENLIIDLRGNGGGIMREALAMLDEVIDGNKSLLKIEGRKYGVEEYLAERPGAFEAGRLAILIDEGSASASEIVAGAVQDWDRGVIIGRRSFGKGLVQQPYELRDGSSLHLTIARYYTPSGRSIQRSYENGNQEYYDDFYSRYGSGELLSADSIKLDSALLKYTQISKRPVYGGGGIVPDFFVGVDTVGNNRFLQEVSINSIIPQFTYDFYSDNIEMFNGFEELSEFENQFFVTNSTYNDFVDLATSRLKNKTFSDRDIAMSKQEISQTIKALVAKQKFGNKGLYTILDDDDDAIAKAMEVFRGEDYKLALAEY
ncbi:MAG: S41 family peptidase [Saprospiraceae bacterium]|nr:S41 family peptidase [Saprospiraceae bacterium]